jgi:hypothetical protein
MEFSSEVDPEPFGVASEAYRRRREVFFSGWNRVAWPMP